MLLLLSLLQLLYFRKFGLKELASICVYVDYIRQTEAEFRACLIGLGFKHMVNGTFLGDV
jgi:hypothetical protein